MKIEDLISIPRKFQLVFADDFSQTHRGFCNAKRIEIRSFFDEEFLTERFVIDDNGQGFGFTFENDGLLWLFTIQNHSVIYEIVVAKQII